MDPPPYLPRNTKVPLDSTEDFKVLFNVFDNILEWDLGTGGIVIW